MTRPKCAARSLPGMFPRTPIVLFCAALDGDGVARNTVRLANALHGAGAPVEVVTLRGGVLADELAGPSMTRLGQGRLPRGLALAAATPALSAMLRRLDPALAVSMGNHAHLPLWAALRPFGEVPRIYRISNDPDHGARNGGGRWRRLGLRLIAEDATRLICVSQRSARAPMFRRVRRDRRLHVIPNGVDAAEVRTRAARPVSHPWLEDGRPFVAAVGRAHPQKNYDGLLEALAHLHRAGRGDLRLLILGRASPRMRAMLMQRAASLGLDAHVRLEGEVADPFPLLSRAAVYALPSRWEGASNSLLEALACGLPVVAARSAGNAPEVLADGRYGVLADAEDPRDLARAILRQASPATRILPGDRASHFSHVRATEAVLDVIRAAVGQHDENQTQSERAGHLRGVDGAWAGEP